MNDDLMECAERLGVREAIEDLLRYELGCEVERIAREGTENGIKKTIRRKRKMDKKILEKLNYCLDWCFCQMDPDRKVLEDDLTKLLEEAYSKGWSDAKDDSEEEGGMCGLVEG